MKNKDLPTLADARWHRKNCKTERFDNFEEEKELGKDEIAEVDEHSIPSLFLTPSKTKDDIQWLTLFGDFSNMSKVSIDYQNYFSHEQEKIFTFAGHSQSALETIESYKISYSETSNDWNLESIPLLSGRTKFSTVVY